MAAPLAVGSTVNLIYNDNIMPGGTANRQVTNGTAVTVNAQYLEFTFGGVDYVVPWANIKSITVS